MEKGQRMEFHIKWDDPVEPHWPRGAWSVYWITGDEIADRTVRERIVKPENSAPAYYAGGVIARHSWCGFETLSEATAAIEALKAER